jgi:two-component system chemotaxis response regulator CheB
MTVNKGGIVLNRDAKEHHTRPAVDPLFRSAADYHGVRTMGVILTGDLNDGTEGLDRIKRAGGRTLAQDPREAVAPGMPQHAILRGAADEVAILVDIPARVVAWCESMHGAAVTRDVLHVVPAPDGAASPGDDDRTVFVCPTCKGSLRRTGELPDGFACYTGHRFNLQTLGWAQNRQTDEALWTAYRALCEKSFLNWLLVEEARSLGNEGDAARHEERASESERLAAIVRAVASRAGGTLAVPEG